jgi:hypothetical protein
MSDYFDLGSYGRQVTGSARAQTWFTRGLVRAYAFNHEAAAALVSRDGRAHPGILHMYIPDGDVRAARGRAARRRTRRRPPQRRTIRLGKAEEAGIVMQQLKIAAARADVPIRSSYYCRLGAVAD